MCELGQSSPLVRYSRQNLWAEAATAHVLLGGPRLNVLRQKWVFYYPIEKLMSSADIDASHFTTACEASIWPHTYKNGILPPGLVRAPVEAVAVRGEVPRDTGAERDLPRPSYPIPSLTMHAHELACLSFALPAHHPRSVARCFTPYVKLFIFLVHF